MLTRVHYFKTVLYIRYLVYRPQQWECPDLRHPRLSWYFSSLKRVFGHLFDYSCVHHPWEQVVERGLESHHFILILPTPGKAHSPSRGSSFWWLVSYVSHIRIHCHCGVHTWNPILLEPLLHPCPLLTCKIKPQRTAHLMGGKIINLTFPRCLGLQDS